jgi:hypothetical protein
LEASDGRFSPISSGTRMAALVGEVRRALALLAVEISKAM